MSFERREAVERFELLPERELGARLVEVERRVDDERPFAAARPLDRAEVFREDVPDRVDDAALVLLAFPFELPLRELRR